jgi:hypothetical protein
VIGRDWRLSTAACYGPFVHPRVTLRCGPWMMILTGSNSKLVYQSSLAALLSGGPVSRDFNAAAPVLVGFLPADTSLERVGGGGRKWEFSVSIAMELRRDLFLHAVKSYDMGPPALFPVRRKVCCGFLSPLKIHRLGRARTRNVWVQWQAH